MCAGYCLKDLVGSLAITMYHCMLRRMLQVLRWAHPATALMAEPKLMSWLRPSHPTQPPSPEATDIPEPQQPGSLMSRVFDAIGSVFSSNGRMPVPLLAWLGDKDVLASVSGDGKTIWVWTPFETQQLNTTLERRS